jgi:hypothetical protein
MNKNNSRIILYFAFGLLLLSGLALIIFHRPILNSLQPPIVLPAPATFFAAADALDTAILKTPRLAALVQRVKNFDFDNICFRPEGALSRLATGATTTEATGEGNAGGTAASSTAALGPAACVPGNNLPFFNRTK